MFYKVLDSFRIDLFVQNDWYRSNSFFIWLLSFPSTICWKCCFFFLNVCFDTFVKNDMIIGKWVSFCILYSIPFVCQFFVFIVPSLLLRLCSVIWHQPLWHQAAWLLRTQRSPSKLIMWTMYLWCPWSIWFLQSFFFLHRTFQDPCSIWIWNTASAAISCWINFFCSLWWWFC